MKRFLGLLCICIVISGAQVPTDQELFEGKTILITGGAGFLGKGIIKALLPYNPKEIRIFSRDEVKHFECFQFFDRNNHLSFILGDVRDYKALLRATKNVDIVIHAGAHKRIDMMESNVEECIKTNILGTLNVFNACFTNKVKKVVFISTDKSASPINIYGACKFVGEKIFNNYAYQKSDTAFMTVRYGNVMHSTGSVIPFFIQKIVRNEAISLTDPRMTRFAIAIEQAVALIFDALRYGVGGELFVRRLPAFKITDLISVLKEKFSSDAPIIITGIRPGEKLHEVLLNQSEASRTYSFRDLYIVAPTIPRNFDTTSKPLYMAEGTRIESESFGEYSSDKEIISIDKVDDLLMRFDIYKKAYSNRNGL